MKSLVRVLTFALLVSSSFCSIANADDALQRDARQAMLKAATYYRENVATHGGYVYHYSLDLKTRWGEGLASKDQIWVQPPGTPTVGMAYVKAYNATGNQYYLDAAVAAAEALVYGQITTGGWTNCIDFDPRGSRVAAYRNGRGKGRVTSSLDDGQTQSAIRCLILVNEATKFQNQKIHDSVMDALDALLNVQFDNGAFPQVWQGPLDTHQPVKPARYPDHDWRTEGRIKEYWYLYTLNDNVLGYTVDTLLEAHRVYQDEKYLTAVKKAGDFLLLAQMPDPQPGWAQQYNYDMEPVWARKFEPAAMASDETQEAISTLLQIQKVTGDEKYLQPIPAALAWLNLIRLPDGNLARYYELKTNRPLYMQRQGKTYSLTNSDANLPSHYGWKIEPRMVSLKKQYEAAKAGRTLSDEDTQQTLERRVRSVIESLDATGRWITTANEGTRLVGQPKIFPGEKYLSSDQFSKNLELLARYLAQEK